LTAKRVGAHGDLRLASGGALFIPLRDAEGALWSRQTIDAQGEKLFLLGGRVKGCYFPLSDRADGPLLIAEGYATAASCLEATGWAAWMALNTGNLEPVAQAARQRFPDRIIVLAADNDRFKLRPNGQAWNPGREAAQAAAKLIRALVCHPEFADEDTQSTDFNDLHRLAGAAEVRRQISEQIPSPLSFLSYDEIAGLDLSDDPVLVGDHVLTQGSLAAILAPGGVGKSRLVQQLAAACVAGHERFLAWEIHPRARELRWIICQAENSAHRLLEERARLRAWLGESAWTRFNRQVRVLVPLKEVDSCLDLDQPEVVARLRQSFQLHLPDIVVFDALYNFSLRELSKGAEMLAAVSACSRVARYANPRRSPILLHHALPGSAGAQRAVGMERATYGRDSKILHQLARSVINLTAISEDSNDQLLVTCGKCSDGREFHPFIIRLNPDTLIYECDPSANVPEVLETVASKKQAKSACPPDRVRELTNLAGSTKAELAQAIMDDCGIWKTNAYRHIARALKHKTVRLSDNGTVFKN
jgi:putative DNA primase/helicase